MICAHGLRFSLKLKIVYCPTPGIASSFNDIFLLFVKVSHGDTFFSCSMLYSCGPGPNEFLIRDGLFCFGNLMPEWCFDGYFYISYDPTAGMSFLISRPSRSPCGMVILIAVRVYAGLYCSGPGIYVLHLISFLARKNFVYFPNENFGLAMYASYSYGLY